MICYKDRTFCGDKVEKHGCGRELTDEDRKSAKELGLPIAWGSFCLDYERNYSHSHCWEQVDNEDSDIENVNTPACGQPLETHKQCCLCDTKYPPLSTSK